MYSILSWAFGYISTVIKKIWEGRSSPQPKSGSAPWLLSFLSDSIFFIFYFILFPCIHGEVVIHISFGFGVKVQVLNFNIKKYIMHELTCTMKFQHVLRETNTAADITLSWLVKKTSIQLDIFVIFLLPPHFVKILRSIILT